VEVVPVGRDSDHDRRKVSHWDETLQEALEKANAEFQGGIRFKKGQIPHAAVE
jgi:hypothetical protein